MLQQIFALNKKVITKINVHNASNIKYKICLPPQMSKQIHGSLEVNRGQRMKQSH